MAFAADFICGKILVPGKIQVEAFACFLMVNHFTRVFAVSELHAGDVLLLHTVVVYAKGKQVIVGRVKTQIAADQLVFCIIAMPVSPFEINGLTNGVEPIVVIFFVGDFEGVQCDEFLLTRISTRVFFRIWKFCFQLC